MEQGWRPLIGAFGTDPIWLGVYDRNCGYSFTEETLAGDCIARNRLPN